MTVNCIFSLFSGTGILIQDIKEYWILYLKKNKNKSQIFDVNHIK